MQPQDSCPNLQSAQHEDLEEGLKLIAEILESHSQCLAHDFPIYRNHASRVFLHCCALLHRLQADPPERLQRAAIVAAFHDLGIWTARTFDYLEPSCMLAREYLWQTARSEWTAEVEEAIFFHHKITPARRYGALAECFRRADWTDVTLLPLYGVPRQCVAAARSQYPYAGFHRQMLRLIWQRFKERPWSPLPMMKW